MANNESVAKQHFISMSQLYRDFYAYIVEDLVELTKIYNEQEKKLCQT